MQIIVSYIDVLTITNPYLDNILVHNSILICTHKNYFQLIAKTAN